MRAAQAGRHGKRGACKPPPSQSLHVLQLFISISDLLRTQSGCMVNTNRAAHAGLCVRPEVRGNVSASYGLPGERLRFCATHRTEGMVGAWPLHSCCACRAWQSVGSACCSPRKAHAVLRCICTQGCVQRRVARASQTKLGRAGRGYTATSTLRLPWYASLLCGPYSHTSWNTQVHRLMSYSTASTSCASLAVCKLSDTSAMWTRILQRWCCLSRYT